MLRLGAIYKDKEGQIQTLTSVDVYFALVDGIIRVRAEAVLKLAGEWAYGYQEIAYGEYPLTSVGDVNSVLDDVLKHLKEQLPRLESQRLHDEEPPISPLAPGITQPSDPRSSDTEQADGQADG